MSPTRSNAYVDLLLALIASARLIPYGQAPSVSCDVAHVRFGSKAASSTNLGGLSTFPLKRVSPSDAPEATSQCLVIVHSPSRSMVPTRGSVALCARAESLRHSMAPMMWREKSGSAIITNATTKARFFEGLEGWQVPCRERR